MPQWTNLKKYEKSKKIVYKDKVDVLGKKIINYEKVIVKKYRKIKNLVQNLR